MTPEQKLENLKNFLNEVEAQTEKEYEIAIKNLSHFDWIELNHKLIFINELKIKLL